MLRQCLILCVLTAGAAQAARPILIHESQRIDPPAGGYTFFGYSLAVDGDWAIITAGIQTPSSGFPETDDALLYRRVNGSWTLDRRLVRDATQTNEDWTGLQVAMRDGVAALSFSPLYLFKRSGNTWSQIPHPFTAAPGSPDWVNGEVAWSGRTLLGVRRSCDFFAARPWGALTATLNPDGSWTPLERLTSSDTGCYEEPASWGISGNTVVAATYTSDFEVTPDKVRIFRHGAGGWSEAPAIEGGDGQADVRGTDIFYATRGPGGTLVYRNDDSQTVVDNLRTVSASYRESGRAYALEHSDDLVLQKNRDDDRRGDLINVFRKNTAGRYEHVAILSAKGEDSLNDDFVISGRRVLVNGYHNRTSANPAVYAFDLPETLVPSPNFAFGFESGGAAGWTPQLGRFDVVAGSASNHVYRQSTPTGDYRALLQDSDWTDQSIEADISPTAFAGADRWAGLAVRYADASNYYYVTLRSSGTIELRRQLGGTYTTLMSKPLPVTAGGHYHVALKALGEQLFVYVDGKNLIWLQDDAIARGRAGLVGYRAQVNYDNVVVNQIGQSTIHDRLYTCHSQLSNERTWILTGTGTWGCPEYDLLQQTSTTGDARAMVGTPTDDQIVKARARATAFAPSSGNQERWFGLAARYTGPTNYYYLSVRNSGTVSLRKVVNGAITVLGTATLPVSAGTWYDLRLDAIGNELHGFVNGVQVLQAFDGTHANGQSGAVTFKSAAEFQGYLSWQP